MGLVTERWTGYKLQRGQSATRIFDLTGFANQADAEEALLDVVSYGDAHPLDAAVKVQTGGITIEILSVGRHYMATVQYTSPDGGGDSSQVEKLLSEKWRFKFDWVIETEESDRTATGVPVLNSGRDPFDKGIPRKDYSGHITMWRWELGTDVIAKNNAYKNRVNSDAVTLPVVGTANAGELLVVSIAFADEIQAGSGKPVKVIYTFDARPLITAVDGDPIHGFHERKLDLGWRGKAEDGQMYDFTHKDGNIKGQKSTVVIRLDGSGKPLDTDKWALGPNTLDPKAIELNSAIKKETTDDGVFLYYDNSDGAIAFSGLSIGANL